MAKTILGCTVETLNGEILADNGIAEPCVSGFIYRSLGDRARGVLAYKREMIFTKPIFSEFVERNEWSEYLIVKGKNVECRLMYAKSDRGKANVILTAIKSDPPSQEELKVAENREKIALIKREKQERIDAIEEDEKRILKEDEKGKIEKKYKSSRMSAYIFFGTIIFLMLIAQFLDT